MSEFHVYNGKEFLGCINERKKRFIAADAEGIDLGEFATIKAAAGAVVRSAFASKKAADMIGEDRGAK